MGRHDTTKNRDQEVAQKLLAAVLAQSKVKRLLLRPGVGGSPEPSFGRKLFMLAHASNSVPSTEKCSLDQRTDFRARAAQKRHPPLDHRSGRPAVSQRAVEGSAGGL
jgi:hypothetical protein